MQARSKARAIVALAAAYALVLQTTLLVVGGALAGTNGLAAASLCSQHKRAGPGSTPSDQADGCVAACLACCCAALAPAAAPPAVAYRRTPAQRIAAHGIAAPILPLRVARSHRSRAPPLG